MSFINRGVHGYFDQGSYVFFDPDIVITDPGNYLYFFKKKKRKKLISISSHNLTFPFLNCELGLLEKVHLNLHLNERPFVKSRSNELDIVIKSLNKQSEFEIYRNSHF